MRIDNKTLSIPMSTHGCSAVRKAIVILLKFGSYRSLRIDGYIGMLTSCHLHNVIDGPLISFASRPFITEVQTLWKMVSNNADIYAEHYFWLIG